MAPASCPLRVLKLSWTIAFPFSTYFAVSSGLRFGFGPDRHETNRIERRVQSRMILFMIMLFWFVKGKVKTKEDTLLVFSFLR